MSRSHWLAAVIAGPALALTVACSGGDSPTATAEPREQQPTETAAPTTTVVATAEPSVAATQALSGAELGRSVAGRNGCAACHSVDGSAGIGPSWLGLFGGEEQLADGTTVTVDDAYLERAILEPNAEIVRGFVGGLMPDDYASKLSDEQLAALIVYIKSLN